MNKGIFGVRVCDRYTVTILRDGEVWWMGQGLTWKQVKTKSKEFAARAIAYKTGLHFSVNAYFPPTGKVVDGS